MLTPNKFPSVIIFRSATDISVGVELKFSFRVTNQIRSSDSYILLQIARDQLIVTEANNANMLIS